MSGTFSSWISDWGLRRRVTRRRGQFSGSWVTSVVRGIFSLFCFWLLLVSSAAAGTIDDAIASALRTIGEYAKQGYAVHGEDEWGGDLGVNESKAISHPLVHGNDYWFCLGTDVSDARVNIHVYNEQGQLVETKAWQNGSQAAAEAVNPRTANYYIVVEVTASPAERTHWAMVYGSKAVGDGRKPL
jgi:hypothetical protein